MVTESQGELNNISLSMYSQFDFIFSPGKGRLMHISEDGVYIQRVEVRHNVT